jgi:hypothetical protein
MSSISEIFPVVIEYNKVKIKTKALKISYPRKECLYKIVLPSKISTFNQCWLARKNSFWKLIVGATIERDLIKAITEAILSYEEQYIEDARTAKPGLKLQSA